MIAPAAQYFLGAGVVLLQQCLGRLSCWCITVFWGYAVLLQCRGNGDVVVLSYGICEAVVLPHSSVWVEGRRVCSAGAVQSMYTVYTAPPHHLFP